MRENSRGWSHSVNPVRRAVMRATRAEPWKTSLRDSDIRWSISSAVSPSTSAMRAGALQARARLTA